MRDAADDVDTHVQRAPQVLDRTGRAVVAVLREGDELEIEIGPDLLAHVQKRLDPGQAVVADVLSANGEQSLPDREVATARPAR